MNLDELREHYDLEAAGAFAIALLRNQPEGGCAVLIRSRCELKASVFHAAFVVDRSAIAEGAPFDAGAPLFRDAAGTSSLDDIFRRHGLGLPVGGRRLLEIADEAAIARNFLIEIPRSPAYEAVIAAAAAAAERLMSPVLAAA